MRILRTLSLATLLLGMSFGSMAQKNYKREADVAFEGEKYFKCIEMYKKAYSKERKAAIKAEILFKIGEAYRLSDQCGQAEVWYDKAQKAQYPDPVTYLHIANCKKQDGKYDEAIAIYNKFKAANPSDPRGDAGIEACKNATNWKENPTRYEVTHMPVINSEQYDFSPAFSDKKAQEIYFTSTRPGSTGSSPSDVTGQSFADIYVTKRDKNGKWSEPTLLGPEINSEFEEGASCVNSKANQIFFTRCKFDKVGKFGCQILTAKRSGNKWSEPEIIPVAADSFAVGHPAISPDDQTLVFASDMPGGYGGKDLWYIVVDKKAKGWSQPVNLGPEINTPGNEMFPFIKDDGTLYFASDGHPGMGGLDIFSAESKGTNQWGKVENMQFPINSNANDFAIVFEGNETRGFFTSNRQGGKGADDIWEFYMPPLRFALRGTVRDIETKQLLANAVVKIVGTDGTSAEVKTDSEGFFEFEKNGNEDYIKANTSYSIVVIKEKYLNAKGKESTVGFKDSKIFEHEYELQPIIRPIVLPEIVYPYNEFYLTDQAKDSLNFLYNVLIDNPNITIELRANTDSRGKDAYNVKLSQKRAESAVNYLIERGIEADRMKPKGYGKQVPRTLDRDFGPQLKKGTVLTEAFINSFKNNKELFEQAHQLNRRTEFSILSTDYVSKKKTEGQGE